MSSLKNIILKYNIAIFSIFSYFFLFYFKNYSISGSQSDFKLFYFNNIQLFKNEFSTSINNYGILGDANYPLDYIFHAFLNPFSHNEKLYLISTLFIGFFTFIIFAKALSKNKFSNSQSVIIGSLILLLPWFSGRAYWGTSANLGIFFLILSFYFFMNIKNNKNLISKKDIFFLCLFSSAALYTRNSYIFFPIYVVLYLFLNNIKLQSKFYLIIFYFIFSLPGFFLIILWGDIHDTKNLQIYEMHNLNNIPKNLPILLNYIFFYLWPIFLIQFKNLGFKDFYQKHRNSFFLSLLFFVTMSFLGQMEYLSNIKLGGGVILEITHFLNDSYNIIFILSSCAGFSIVYYLLKYDIKNNVILLIPILFIFGFPKALYQDYLEPLIFFLFFLGIIKNEFMSIIKKNFYSISIIYFIYFVIYNYSSIIYKNFIIS